MRLKLIGMLILVAGGLIAMVHSLIEGDLWVAGLGAFFAALLLISYRRDKRKLEREP
jgi:O-antigen/teichoic acid export membrane protein